MRSIRLKLKDQINRGVNAFLFLAPGAYLLFQDRVWMGSFFLFVGVFLLGTAIPLIQESFIGRFFKDSSPYLKNGLVWIMWVALSLTTLRFDCFGWAFTMPPWFFSPFLWLQGVMFIGLVAAVRTKDDKDKPVKDFSALTAHICFWLILALALVMRVYKLSSPEGSYGFDEAGGVMETRLVRDLDDYRQGYYIAYYQKPIYCYITLFLWHWMPKATDLFILRITAILCDLGSIWMLYLVGKEVGGRRMGVLMSAMGAISKPLLNITAMGMGVVMVPFFVLLPLLFALRLFKKPSLAHFLQLGFALALGIYNNEYVRIDLLFFIASVFVWIAAKKENRTLKKKGAMGWVVLFNLMVLICYYFYMSVGFTQSSWMYQLVNNWQGLVFVFMAACCLSLIVLGYVPYIQLKSAKKNKIWIDALLSLWLCTLLDYPMMTRPDFLERLDHLVNDSGGAFSVSLLQTWDKLIDTCRLLFWSGTWPANMGVINDSFFEYGATVFIFLGLAFFISRPTWLKTFIFFILIGGVLPHVLVGGNHNARISGAIGPFLLLAIMGAEDLFRSAHGLSKSKGRFFYGACLAFFVAFGAWCGWTTYDRVNHQWFDNQILYFTGARNIAEHEIALGNRVYFCDDVFTVESAVINEGMTIHRLFATNIIYRAPTDKPQDVSIVIHDFSANEGKTAREAILKNFPNAAWFREGEVSYCRIPYSSISNKRQKMFTILPEDPATWKRKYILNECGLIFDLLAYEDEVKRVDQPVSPEYATEYDDAVHENVEAICYSATIHISHDGDYIVHYKAENRSWLKIDGKMVSNLSFFRLFDYWAPPKMGDDNVHLTQGDHQVEVVTAFQRSDKLPEFWIRAKGAAAPGTSLWDSFTF